MNLSPVTTGKSIDKMDRKVQIKLKKVSWTTKKKVIP